MTPMSGHKPFSAASERNREPLLAVLAEHFADRCCVLEIGSGTGQHAVHFARALPHLAWQCSDMSVQLPGIRLWLDEAGLANTPAPLALDVDGAWPAQRFDAVFTANTLHIMAWEQVLRMFACLPGVMTDDALLAVYGPFNYAGRFTSPGNANFDASLKASASHMGIRGFEAVDGQARMAGLELVEDRAMPANNRCVIWCKQRSANITPG